MNEGAEPAWRGGSAIFGPEGSYLAESWFDPAGHYHRLDVFEFSVRGS